jgi:hypothetical protein
MTEEPDIAERKRLRESEQGERNWKFWGPYLSERQWGTVREDYSSDGNVWGNFTHEESHSRVYRWGEDGLLGFTDRDCRLCFSPVLWNERDPILKERLFGLTGHQGNHGEDVKECYYYLDGTPSHSYMKALYRYPQRRYPYRELVEENARRGVDQDEYELTDTGVFADDRYFDLVVEYAKRGPEDLLIRLRVVNRGPKTAPIHLLPSIWFRNTWIWGREEEDGYWSEPHMQRDGDHIRMAHDALPEYRFQVNAPEQEGPEWLFTNNETNHEKLFNTSNRTDYVKDGFHEYLIDGNEIAVNPDERGTKAAAAFQFDLPAGASRVIQARLCRTDEANGPIDPDAFETVFQTRKTEADQFYQSVLPDPADDEERQISRQAYAGLVWTKQFYFFDVSSWMNGDPAQPAPPAERKNVRNRDWQHLHNRDIVSMPDKWEYPWYAAWDLAFHTLSFARIDPEFAKEQLLLFLEERYMHPNGAIPSYEFGFSDVNPPVHAWAVWRVYKMTAPEGERDRDFLARCFRKLLLNFTWWVNRKDRDGNNVFGGGFLGLDNIGVFDRSSELPGGGHLEQADGTAWMAFYCGTMLNMALELAREDNTYEDMAMKFFDHFVTIADAMNNQVGGGLWDEDDGFYYDHMHVDNQFIPVKLRSLVGLMPLVAVEPFSEETLNDLPGFRERCEWYEKNRPEIMRLITCDQAGPDECSIDGNVRLLAIPSQKRLERILDYLFDEDEFLSDYGIRSLSKHHEEQPFVCDLGGETRRVEYEPGESRSSMFGGNSNWRGPIWFPINFLLIEALERYNYFYDDRVTVEDPDNPGEQITLDDAAHTIADRLVDLFRRDENGQRPCHGSNERYREGNEWDDCVLFYEYFHGDTGRGCGASHQTGWTALVAQCIEKIYRNG